LFRKQNRRQYKFRAIEERKVIQAFVQQVPIVVNKLQTNGLWLFFFSFRLCIERWCVCKELPEYSNECRTFSTIYSSINNWYESI